MQALYFKVTSETGFRAGPADQAAARAQLSAESLGPDHFPALEALPGGSRKQLGKLDRGEGGGQERGGNSLRNEKHMFQRPSQRARGRKVEQKR